MQPEISRRCRSCGAAVRAGARFCPQCGNRFVEEGGGEPAAGEGSRPPEGRETAAPRAEAVGSPWGSPPTPTAPKTAAEGEASGGLRATRETVTPTRETAAPGRETVAPTRETVAPTRETAVPPQPFQTAAPSQPFAGGVAGQTSPGFAGPGARATSAGPSASPTDGGTSVEGYAPARTTEASAAEGEGGAGRPRRAAARVKETVMPRVEKMRDEALVALEETPDDSGLRFVVIAVVLFGLFLLFLFLSVTVLR
jgi:zinc-ribbon domain